MACQLHYGNGICCWKNVNTDIHYESPYFVQSFQFGLSLTFEKFLDSIKPSGAGNLVVYKGGKFVRESVNEAVEPTGNIKKVLDVAKNKQAKKIGGTLVDLTTSSMMTQVWDKVNDSSKEKMNKMNTKQLINLILKLWDRMGTQRV